MGKKEDARLSDLQLWREPARMIWHSLLFQADERDEHVGFATALLVTWCAHPYVEYDEIGLRDLIRKAMNRCGGQFWSSDLDFHLEKVCLKKMSGEMNDYGSKPYKLLKISYRKAPRR